jgi:hypothetical protein
LLTHGAACGALPEVNEVLALVALLRKVVLSPAKEAEMIIKAPVNWQVVD